MAGLAYRCVCYMIPEFSRQTLESLRQPLETGRATIARANAHSTYPARFLRRGPDRPGNARSGVPAPP